ncbi:aldo/keto reductase [Anaeromicropila populeti]|uniref:L-glyceraldehyde 3-phosphate reductase n=1 Tax=Anaeromicropila populeti TaxID=37658 RepID=A0A1I6L0B9_9FIRM|nr:aldo/keto reductase [Anaeromicropila populeti]SFR96926.1 L-glyceraldehyde 3-phosphate reductase [Anaeromicropila populeti]
MYLANEQRYCSMIYKSCGNSGLKLPVVSLGLWHNFGNTNTLENMTQMITTAFDCGITHFDLANNYGPNRGAAEVNFGKIINNQLYPYRDECIISTKAGYVMWPGPYGNWGSRKYLIASLDQSLSRLGLDYVDIFYHHRPDPSTPLEETMSALDHVVRSGKALYIGLSNYQPEQLKKACDILNSLGTPAIIHQTKYSMMEQQIKNGLIQVHREKKIGSIAFSPLAQGILTDKYLNGIPENSRAADQNSNFLTQKNITDAVIEKVHKLNHIAQNRNQTIAQLALSWAVKTGELTSLLVGASTPSQIINNVNMLSHLDFTDDELAEIDAILN